MLMRLSGMVFERAYAHSGWTLPSTVSMMTGLYPHEHRVGRAPDAPSEFGSLPKERVTMAEVFTIGRLSNHGGGEQHFFGARFRFGTRI